MKIAVLLGIAFWTIMALVLAGCGGFALIRQPEPGCRTIITSEAAGAQFAQDVGEQYLQPTSRAVRIIRREEK